MQREANNTQTMHIHYVTFVAKRRVREEAPRPNKGGENICILETNRMRQKDTHPIQIAQYFLELLQQILLHVDAMGKIKLAGLGLISEEG